MTIGSWDPNASQEQSFAIKADVLQQFIHISASGEPLDIKSALSNDDIATQAPIMRLDMASWQQATEQLSNQDLVGLIKFFTLAEEQLTGWEGQERSPVIYINKVLKNRKSPLTKEMLLWIRANSQNRFLPNGAL